jgi:hypothetical protein
MATLGYGAAAQVGGKQRYIESLFLCVKRGDLRYLIELLTKDPEAINAREEVGLHHREKKEEDRFICVCVCYTDRADTATPCLHPGPA